MILLHCGWENFLIILPPCRNHYNFFGVINIKSFQKAAYICINTLPTYIPL